MKVVGFNQRVKSFNYPRCVSVLGGEDVSLMVHINSVEDETFSSSTLNMTGEQAAELGATLIQAALLADREEAIKAMEAVRLQLFAEEAEAAEAYATRRDERLMENQYP